jgi:CheY-like chemotaxis protein
MSNIRDLAILVVGDDTSFSYLMQRYVRECGYRALVSRPSLQTLALAQQERPEAIVLEIEQGDATGWDLLRSLKANQATQCIPILVCSWLEYKDRCLAEGAEYHLQKPVLYEDFVAALTAVGVLDAGGG